VKALDIVSTTSGNTWNMAINNQYQLYTPNQNDSVIVSYGDSSTQTFNLTSSKISKKLYIELKIKFNYY
jgi:hypothetical protein